MLSKFFTALKPKEYSVQVLRDNTSQKAVRRIKRTRTTVPLKKIATVALVLSFIGGGLASAMAATGVTANQAQANPITDMVCIKGDGADGSWSGGTNAYGIVGGRAQFAMADNSVGRNTKPSDSALHGWSGDWGGSDAPSGGKYLTAYEKYGMLYPQYDAWVPVYTDKDITIKQVDSSYPNYSTGDGKLPATGGNEIKAGSSPLATSDVGACMALMPTMSAAVSNMIAVLPRFVMGASIELYSASYGASMANPHSVLHSLGDSIDAFISTPNTGLRDSLFIPFMLPLILIGAIWIGYVGIVKRAAMQAVQSTAWMIVAIALGTVFLAQPTLIASMVDNVVAQTQGIVNEAILKSSKSEDMCNLDGSNDTSINKTLRETQCTIWHSTIYSTWVAGQFGVSSSDANNPNSVLTQTAGRVSTRNTPTTKHLPILADPDYAVYYGSDNPKQAKSWPQFMIDRQVTNKSPELSEVAWAQLSGNGGAKINHQWSGSTEMISSAIMMFFGAGASSAVLFTYGFALLIYQLMMISAVIMSPFFFLVGIVPNWGRRVLVRYAELLASLAVKRIMTGTLLALYLLFYKIIVGDAQGNSDGLILRIILVGALALFFISSRSKFIKMFADNINFGGNKSIGLPGNKAAAITAGLGAGLLGGGLIGGAIVAHKSRKENKDVEGNLKNIKLDGGNPTADIKTPPRGPNSGANGESNVTPTKVLSKTANTVRDVKDNVNTAKKAKSFIDKNLTNKGAGQAAQGSQGASNATSGTTTRITSTTASKGATVTPQGMPVASAAPTATAGGAGATVAPTAATGAAASGGAGIVGGGAAAAGGVGVGVATGGAAGAASGAAVSGTVAAGGVAVTGTVAAGAAAGSVVPVVGTVVGAAAGAAIVAAKQKKKAEEG